MSKADEADDLYADLYGEEADTSSKPPAQPDTAAAPAPAPAPAPAAPASGSFIPGAPSAPPVATPFMESAEERSAAAARGEHVAPQDLPDEG